METYSNNLIVFDISTIAMYLIAFVGGFNWRVGLLYRKDVFDEFKSRKKRISDMLAWVAGYFIRASVILICTWLVINHYDRTWIQINSWGDMLTRGLTYVWMLWVVSWFISAIFEDDIGVYTWPRRIRDGDVPDRLFDYCWFTLAGVCIVSWGAWLILRLAPADSAMNLASLYLISVIGGFNWRLGLLPGGGFSKRRARKNRLMWFAGYAVRVIAIFCLTSSLLWIVGSKPSIGKENWLIVLWIGMPYVVGLWGASGHISKIEFNYSKNRRPGISDDIAYGAWAACSVALLAIWMAWNLIQIGL